MGKNFKDSINKTNLPAKSGISALIGGSQLENKEVTPTTSITPVTPTLISHQIDEDVRQTFIIKTQLLEKIKDYVHLKRQEGYSFYTQKEAMNDALEIFFNKIGDVPERPLHIKQAEQLRNNKKSRK